MNILIKSFRRPFALDLCLTSLRRYVRNHERVVVLDDGTDMAHIQRLTERHPGVAFFLSPAAPKKKEVIAEVFARIHGELAAAPAGPDLAAIRMVLPPGYDPAPFWVEGVRQLATERFLLLEEDCRILRPLDLAHIDAVMAEERAIYARLFWLGSERFSAAHLAVPGTVRAGDPALERYDPATDSGNAGWLFQVAMAAFSRDYWLAAQESQAPWMMEEDRFAGAARYYASHQGANGLLRSLEPCFDVCVKTSCTVRGPDARDGFNVFDVNDALADEWMERDLPLDEHGQLASSGIMAICEKRLGPGYGTRWAHWYQQIKEFHARLGFRLPD